MDAAKDLAANFGVPFKIFDAIWDTGELGYKVNRLYKKFEGMASSLGNDTFEKLFNALNMNGFNFLEGISFGQGDWRKAINISGKGVSEFWDDLMASFAPSNVDFGPPERFQIPGTNIWVTLYISTSGDCPSIQIGNYKFRFAC